MRKSPEYEQEMALGRPTDKEPYLCIFNLRYQLMNAKRDCNKGANCTRDHYDRKLKGTAGYRWTLATLSKEVQGAPAKILKSADKIKLVEELTAEFSR